MESTELALETEIRQHAFPHRDAKIRIARLPSQRAELLIAHPLVTLAALSFCREPSLRRLRLFQLQAQPFINFGRCRRLVIYDIIDLPPRLRAPLRQEEQGRDD